MTDIEELRGSISRALDEEEGRRDIAYSRSRDLIRSCRKVISSLVHGEEMDLSSLMNEKEELLGSGRPNIGRYGFVDDALTEYAEAIILHTVMNGEGLPEIETVGVGERAYVLGACDTVGELRRVTLNRLLGSELDEAVNTYEMMKELGHLIEGLVYPSGMIPLKKKQDVVRSLLDRTGGELAIALTSRRGSNTKEGGTHE